MIIDLGLGRVHKVKMDVDNIGIEQGRRSLALYIDALHPISCSFHLDRSKGSAASPSTVLSKGLLIGVGALGGIGHAALGLPVLRQIEGGDLLGFLDLLLVGLDLTLQLIDESLHSLVVLPVLVLLVAQLLDL